MRYPWLFVLIAVAIVALIARSLRRLYAAQRKNKKAVMIAHSKKIKALPEYERARKKRRLLLILAAVSFVVSVISTTFSAARPVSVDEVRPDYETRDIMLCMDISGSQQDSASSVLRYFSDAREKLHGQRIGVGVFASKTAIISPLTNDYDAITDVLKDLAESFSVTNSSSNGLRYLTNLNGTQSAIGDGIINCASGFDKLTEDGRSQSMILATDGLQNAGAASIIEAGYYLARYHITLYIVDATKKESSISANERVESLIEAANITGGIYYNSNELGIKGEQAAGDIMKQEAAKHDGVAQFIWMDSPKISTIAALCSTVVFLSIIWRLKL